MNNLPELIGVPFDVGCRPNTSQTIDSRNAPEAIRTKLKKIFSNFNIELPFRDAGDIEAEHSVASVLSAVQARVNQLLEQNKRFCLLGGAHTLTLGSLRGLAQAGKEVSLIYFDAHPDLMPRSEIDYGSTLFHAIKEGILKPDRLALIGIRQIEDEEQKIIKDNNILVVSPFELETTPQEEVIRRISQQCAAPYFMSIDLDALDPCFAPGVSTPYPLGMRPRELLGLAGRFFTPDLLGFELVELAPALDRNEETTHLAAAMLLELHKLWNSHIAD